MRKEAGTGLMTDGFSAGESGASITPVGIIESPYREKFSVPRQSGLASNVISRVRILPPYDTEDAFRGIGEFSHLWLIFGFSLIEDHSFRPLVRPPRLGGNTKVGVFASRSPFRPNSLGLSSVRNGGVSREDGRLYLTVLGADLVTGTPVYDIKPYIRFSDSHPDAVSGFARKEPVRLLVEFSDEALSELEALGRLGVKDEAEEILSYDPRPAYQHESGRIYGVRLWDLNFRYTIENGTVRVTSVEKSPD